MQFQTLVVLSIVALGASEAYRFQRVEQAPYPAAGYRPAGQEFRLPERQTVYGPPPAAYGPPAYGPPDSESTTTEGDVSTTTDLPTTTEYVPARAQLRKSQRVQTRPVQLEKSQKVQLQKSQKVQSEKSQKVQEEEEILDQGVYYIYHPSGFLQRVSYQTKSDISNMGFTAQLSYRDVEPIQEPIYAYNPETYAYQQITL